MTRTISLITAIAATALLAVPAAWGQTPPDAFERTAGTSTRATSQDAFERAIADRSANAPDVVLHSDAFDRAVAAQSTPVLPSSDAFERTAMAALGSTASSSDAVLRAVASRSGLIAGVVGGDQHERGTLAIAAPVAPLSASSSDSGVAWPQIGIGFALGLVLALGLALAMRVARPRELVH